MSREIGIAAALRRDGLFDTMTSVTALALAAVPEFVVGSWWGQLLHNQSALLLKGRLLFRKGTVVTSVPYHLN